MRTITLILLYIACWVLLGYGQFWSALACGVGLIGIVAYTCSDVRIFYE